MSYDFPRYLLSKRSVDDRALNKDVLAALRANLPEGPISIVEAGGGIGTMLARLLQWNIISRAEYTIVDAMAENVEFARSWVMEWANENGLQTERVHENQLRLFGALSQRSPYRDRDHPPTADRSLSVLVKLVQGDVFDFADRNPEPADLLIAHALLDVLPLPEGLQKLLSLTRHLAWLTLNFDGVTALEPAVEAELDAKIERLYHETMDTRASGGDSRSGRHLFRHLARAGAEILAAGSSDWVVHPMQGRYPADEEYFLHFILHFFEESLGDHPELDSTDFSRWLRKRRSQVEGGELTYIAHQIDFLVR